jgi:hypothetical protein
MFRTELITSPYPQKIKLQNQLLLIGSCFSDNIGKILEINKFKVLINPFGVIYNPISIFSVLEKSLQKKELEASTFVQHQEIWHNYHFHSEVSALTMNDLQIKTVEKLNRVGEWLGATSCLMLTLGTAFAYRLKENGEIVANCHKIPAQYFDKELLTSQQIVAGFENLYQILPKNTAIILTVSPVRHLKETLPLNSVSKAVLRIACHELTEKFENVSYFPAFEYVIDDLRDYRFYEADMLHPTTQAIDYVFAKFAETYFDKPTQAFVEKWKKIYKSLQHHAFYPETKAHQQFLGNLLQQLMTIREIDVSQEIELVKQQMSGQSV